MKQICTETDLRDVFWVLLLAVSLKLTDVSEVLTASINIALISLVALMMESVSTFETSINLYETARHNIPDNSHLHILRRENLKSHRDECVSVKQGYC
jgi:hypothetical protein